MLIRDVNVVDVVTAAVKAHLDVCIEGTDIVAVQAHSANIPESEVLVSGSGRFLIPGLNDMPVHFRGGEEAVDENRDLLPLYLAHGITGVYDLGSDIASHLVKW